VDLTKEVKDKIDAERFPQFRQKVEQETFSDPNTFLLKDTGEMIPINRLN
jgi:hypothetical protein